jgi:hypothetical protein
MKASTKEKREEISGSEVAVIEVDKSLAVNNATAQEGSHGDFNIRETTIPYLAIVQGVGDLAGKHTGGSIVFNKIHVLAGPKQAIGLTVFRNEKFYSQNLKYDPTGPKRQIFLSEEEVLKSGGNLNTGVEAGKDPNNFIPGAFLSVAAEVREELSDVTAAIPFVHDKGTKFIVRALWTVQRTAFFRTVPNIRLYETGLKARNLTLPFQALSLETDWQKLQSNWTHVPVLTPTGINSLEYVNFLRGIFS